MSDSSLKSKINAELDGMSSENQRSVLNFAKAINRQHAEGEPGKHLLRFARMIDRESAAEMKKAIEGGCERIDGNEW